MCVWASLYLKTGIFSWGCSKLSSRFYPNPPPPWLHSASRAPNARPTCLHRYFLRKTYHLRLDPSARYAETAAAPAHNPPQASTSRSLPFYFLSALSVFFTFSCSLARSPFFIFPPRSFSSIFLRFSSSLKVRHSRRWKI